VAIDVLAPQRDSVISFMESGKGGFGGHLLRG